MSSLPTPAVAARSRHLRWLPVLAACAWSLSSQAAPSSDTPTALEPKAADALPASLGAGVRSSDRTIDLLVEMQQPKAGIQFNERAGRAVAPDGLSRAAPGQPQRLPDKVPQVEAPLTPPSGLFGSGATPAVLARTQNIVDRSSAIHAQPARAAGRPSSDTQPGLNPLLLWPRELVEYVRENRGFVVACAATLLLAAWIVSAMFSRRRG